MRAIKIYKFIKIIQKIIKNNQILKMFKLMLVVTLIGLCFAGDPVKRIVYTDCLADNCGNVNCGEDAVKFLILN